jgi:hypothetical protein
MAAQASTCPPFGGPLRRRRWPQREIKACCKSGRLRAYQPPSPPAKELRFRHQLHLVSIFAPLPGGTVACGPIRRKSSPCSRRDAFERRYPLPKSFAPLAWRPFQAPTFRAMPDHVGSLKGVSSRRLRELRPEVRDRYRRGVLWSPSYFVASCAGAPLSIIAQYVHNQKEKDALPPRPKDRGFRAVNR